MAIRKVCGIETEYGIVLRGVGESNPVTASSLLINAYVSQQQRKVEWDFEDESPGRDARGFAREGAMAPEVETHLVNAVLTNGARYYVDHAHPEYSTPEFSEEEVGLETTLKRPLVNTRDEPHSDSQKYRRLHVIVGDANLAEVSTFLKVGVTSLVLAMIEDDELAGLDLTLSAPVQAHRAVSYDLSLKQPLELVGGRRMTALEMQWELFDRGRKYAESRGLEAIGEEVGRQVLDRWETVLTALETDPMSLAGQLDWVAKYQMVSAYRERH